MFARMQNPALQQRRIVLLEASCHRRRALTHSGSHRQVVSKPTAIVRTLWLSILVLSVVQLVAGNTASSTPASCSPLWPPSQESLYSVSESWHTSSCDSSGCNATKILKIGTALSLDYQSKYGALGSWVGKAYRLYFSWLNKHHGGVTINGEKHWVQLILLDDQSSPTRVKSITEYLIDQQKVVHLLAPFSSGLTGPAAEVVHDRGAVMVAPCSAATSVFLNRPRVFGTLSLSSSFLVAAFDRMKLHATTAAYVYEDLGFTRGVCKVANQLAADRDMRVVFGSVATKEGKLNDNANQSEVDAMIKEVASQSPDFLIGCVYNNVCQRILKSAKEQHFNPNAVILTVCVTQDDFTSSNGDASGYVLGVAPWTNEVQILSDLTQQNVSQLMQMFADMNAPNPPYQAVSAFAAAATLVYGIETASRLDGTIDPAAVANVIQHMDKKSEFGRIAFDANGQGKNPIKMVQVQEGATPVVAPLTAFTKPLRYPKPAFDSMACYNRDSFNVGRYGFFPNGSCLECNQTAVAPFDKIKGHRTCKKLICEPGKHSVIYPAKGVLPGGAFCADCFKGYYAADNGTTQCAGCPVGKYQSSKAQDGCNFCQQGKYAPSKGSIFCTNCPSGQYENRDGSSECKKCPEGSKCYPNDEGLRTRYINADGWYLLEKFDLEGRSYQEPIRCQHGKSGSACVEDGLCHKDPVTGEAAMEGVFCGKCRPGYGRETAEGLCYKCPPFLLSAFFCLLTQLGLIMLAGVVFILVISTDFKKPKNISAVVVKQLLNYLGMSTVVLKSTDLRFPIDVEWMRNILHGARIVFGVESPVFAAHAAECFMSQFGAPHQAYVLLGLVWVPLLVVFLTIVFLLMKGRLSGDHAPRRSRLMTLLIVNLFVVHPRNTELCLNVLNCGHFDKARLMMDAGVDCQSEEHGLWQIIGMIGFVLYSLGIPLGTFCLLRYYKKRDKLTNKKTINTLGFLYCGFEPQHYYFESIFMLRKVLYQLVILIPYLTSQDANDEKTIKCMSMLTLAVAFLAVHIKYMPYDNRAYFTLDRIEAASLWAILVTLVVQTWLYISEDAYVFDVLQNGDAAMTSRNRDIRDGMCVLIVCAFHARFFWLVIYLPSRPFLLSMTRLKILCHGFVDIKEDGLALHEADATGVELFTSMIQELATLLISQRKVINYEELVTSLKCIAVNCNYHRQREIFDTGEAEYDIEREDTTAVRHGIKQACSSKHLHQTRKRAIRHFIHKYIAYVQPKLDQISRIYQMLTKGESGKRKASDEADQETQNRFQEVEALHHFNPFTVQNTIGAQFTIEEFHMALVRLNKNIGKGKSLKWGQKSRGHMDASPSWHSTQHLSRKMMQQILNDEREVVVDDDGEDEAAEPLALDKESAAEVELRATTMELRQLRALHADTVAVHKTELTRMDTQRKDIMHRIIHAQRYNVEVDDVLSQDSDDDDDDTAVRLASAKVEETAEHTESGVEVPAESPPDTEDEEGTRIRAAEAMIKKMSTSAGTGKVPCENCGNMLLVDAFFCRKCGLERGRLHKEEEARQAAKVIDIDKQLAAEDQIFALKFELDVAAHSARKQADELKKEKELVAALKSQIRVIRVEQELGSLDISESRQLDIADLAAQAVDLAAVQHVAFGSDQRPKTKENATRRIELV